MWLEQFQHWYVFITWFADASAWSASLTAQSATSRRLTNQLSCPSALTCPHTGHGTFFRNTFASAMPHSSSGASIHSSLNHFLTFRSLAGPCFTKYRRFCDRRRHSFPQYFFG
jgi:hypothetical protein